MRTQKDFAKILKKKKKKKKNFGKYHDLHVQSDTLVLADASENFRNMS